MVGEGSRFKNAGYSIPKFALPINEKQTTFSLAVESFKLYFKDELFVFIIRDIINFEVEKFLIFELKKMQISRYKIIKLQNITTGQAETVRAGLEVLGPKYFKDELTIFNIDSRRNMFEYDEKFRTHPYLEVFTGEGSQWSFAEFNIIDNSLIRTTEKIRISNYCSNGLYHFNLINDFINIYDSKRDKIKDTYGETYIAPLYNYFIEKNIKCFVKVIGKNKMDFFGTPSDYETYKSFHKN